MKARLDVLLISSQLQRCGSPLGVLHQCMARQPKALFHSPPTLWLATSSPVLSVGAGAGRDVRGL